MEIRSFYCLVLLGICICGKGQVSLVIRELPLNSNKNYIPNNVEALDNETHYPGHLLELSISNESNKSISFPLDTASYALPFTENTWEYYKNNDDILPVPDLYNILGVTAFVYQKGKFMRADVGSMPFYEEIQLQEIHKIENNRLAKIYQWMANKDITDELSATYNWYLINHMVTIPAHKSITYKIYFNPFLKKLEKYDNSFYYVDLDSKVSYDVIFKLILKKNLYKFLTKEDRRKYPNLFTGVISSNRLVFKAAKL